MTTRSAASLLACCLLLAGGVSCQAGEPEHEVTPGEAPVAARAAASIAAPAPAPSAAGPSVSRDDVIVIKVNAQATLGAGDARVGAGNVWEEEYTPEGGAPVRGLTAMLWITEGDDVSRDKHVRVHPGQTLGAAGYTLRVLSVVKEGVSLSATRP